MTRRHLLLLVVLMIGVGCGGAGTEDEIEVGSEEERTLTLGQRALALDVYDGAVSVSGTQDSVAVVTFDKKARAMGEDKAHNLLDTISIEENERSGVYAVAVRSDQPEPTSVDVEGEVPYKAPLKLTVGAGTVEVSGMGGSIEAEVGDGEVHIESAVENLDVTTGNGNITVGMAGFREGARVALTTTNGDIELTLPASVSARLDAETQVGSIDVGGLSFQEEAPDDATSAGDHVTGTLGKGAGEILLRTDMGNITIRVEE